MSKVTVTCDRCQQEIGGKSKEHALKNLQIHKETSKNHLEARPFLEKKYEDMFDIEGSAQLVYGGEVVAEIESIFLSEIGMEVSEVIEGGDLTEAETAQMYNGIISNGHLKPDSIFVPEKPEENIRRISQMLREAELQIESEDGQEIVLKHPNISGLEEAIVKHSIVDQRVSGRALFSHEEKADIGQDT